MSSGWARRHQVRPPRHVLTNTAVHHDNAERIPASLRLALAPAAHGLLTERTATSFLDVAPALAEPSSSREVRAAYRAPYATRARRRRSATSSATSPAAPDHPRHARYAQIAAGVRPLDVPPSSVGHRRPRLPAALPQ